MAEFVEVDFREYLSLPPDSQLSYDIYITGTSGVPKYIGKTDAQPRVLYRAHRSENILSGGDFISFEIEIEFYAFQIGAVTNEMIRNLDAFARGKWIMSFVPIGYPRGAFSLPRRLGFQIEGGSLIEMGALALNALSSLSTTQSISFAAKTFHSQH